jgi:peptide subunit release factor 1 (eRF1)
MNQRNSRYIAIWIDHRSATVLTFIGDDLKKEQEFLSNAGPHTHGGGWSQRRIEAHRHEMLKHFYEEIIQHLGPVDEILILGPGQAKYELRDRIEHHKGLKGKIMDLVSAPEMSEVELITQAEGFFNSLAKNRQK